MHKLRSVRPNDQIFKKKSNTKPVLTERKQVDQKMNARFGVNILTIMRVHNVHLCASIHVGLHFPVLSLNFFPDKENWFQISFKTRQGKSYLNHQLVIVSKSPSSSSASPSMTERVTNVSVAFSKTTVK